MCTKASLLGGMWVILLFSLGCQRYAPQENNMVNSKDASLIEMTGDEIKNVEQDKDLAVKETSHLSCQVAWDKAHMKQQFHQGSVVMAVFAHPDDETWASGSIAKLADAGADIYSIYVSSGGDGKDRSGRQLSGASLSKEREKEVSDALKVLGIKRPPIFFRHEDHLLRENQMDVIRALEDFTLELKPRWVLTFHPLGITDHDDHKVVSEAMSYILEKTPGAFSLFHFGVSLSRAEKLLNISREFNMPYHIRQPMTESQQAFSVDVSEYSLQRKKAMFSHITQFPPTLMDVWSQFVDEETYEEWILVSGNCEDI